MQQLQYFAVYINIHMVHVANFFLKLFLKQFGASMEKESRATSAGASRPAFNDLAMVVEVFRE